MTLLKFVIKKIFSIDFYNNLIFFFEKKNFFGNEFEKMDLVNFINKFGIDMATLENSFVFEDYSDSMDKQRVFFSSYEDKIKVKPIDLGNFLLKTLPIKYNIEIKNKDREKIFFDKDLDIIPNSLYFIEFSTQSEEFFVVLISLNDRVHMIVVGNTGRETFNNEYLIENFKFLWKCFLQTQELNTEGEKEFEYYVESLNDIASSIFSSLFQTSGGEDSRLNTIKRFSRLNNIKKHEKAIILKLINKFKSFLPIFKNRVDRKEYEIIVKKMDDFYKRMQTPKK